MNGQPVDFTYEALNTAMVIPLPRPLSRGESITVEMDFAVKLRPEVEGLGWGPNSFYPLLAVYDGGGWRQDISCGPDTVYSESASYVVDLTAPSSLVIAASGVEVATIKNPDGTVTHSYRGGPLRDFALAMKEDFQVSSEVVDGITVNAYYYPDDEEGGETILKYAAGAVQVYNQRFGLYPFAELDVVVILVPEGGAAGMEYPGLVFISHERESDPEFVEFVTAHEVAHQWWYSVVGNDVLLEPWLDEAFAQYSAVIYYEAVHGREVAEEVFEQWVQHQYRYALETGLRDGPVGQSVCDFDTLNHYVKIVYDKGAIFLDTLRQGVGDETFFAILQEHYQRYKYKVATGEGFLTVAEEVAGRELDDLYDQWIRK